MGRVTGQLPWTAREVKGHSSHSVLLQVATVAQGRVWAADPVTAQWSPAFMAEKEAVRRHAGSGGRVNAMRP